MAVEQGGQSAFHQLEQHWNDIQAAIDPNAGPEVPAIEESINAALHTVVTKRGFLTGAAGLAAASLLAGCGLGKNPNTASSTPTTAATVTPNHFAVPRNLDRLGVAAHLANYTPIPHFLTQAQITHELDLAYKAGARVIRTDAEYLHIEGNQGQPDFRTWNFIVEEAQKRDIGVIAVMITGAAPNWVGTAYDQFMGQDAFTNFCGKFAHNFRGNKGLVGMEFGNEINAGDGYIDPSTYEATFANAINAVWTEDEGIIVISSGLDTDPNTNPLSYASGIHRVSQRQTPQQRRLILSGLHPYMQPNPPQGNPKLDLIKEMNQMTGLQVAVTEINWPIGGTDGSVTEADQATYMQDVLDDTLRGELSSIVATTIVYELVQDDQGKWGIYSPDYTPNTQLISVMQSERQQLGG